MGKTHPECGQTRPVEGGHREQRREVEKASLESAVPSLCFLAGHEVNSSLWHGFLMPCVLLKRMQPSNHGASESSEIIGQFLLSAVSVTNLTKVCKR